MDIKKLSRNDWIVVVGVVLAFIAMFLHWYKVSAMGFSASGGSGWDENLAVLAFIITLVAGVLVMLKAFGANLKLPVAEGLAVMALGAVSVLFVLIKFIDKPGGGSSYLGSIKIGYSIGIFVALIAAVVVTVGGFLKNSES